MKLSSASMGATAVALFTILPTVAIADGPRQPRRLDATPTQVTFTGAFQPAISPSGVLCCSVVDGIRLFDASGNPQGLLAPARWPTWSPGGDRVGFKGGGIGIVDVATLQMTSVCITCNVNNGLAWSPLGDEFVYQDPDDGLVTVSYPGGAISIVPCGGCEGEGPTWSPDGQWIAFEDGLEILKVPRGGGTPDTVFAGAGGAGDPTHPAWSPDGRWIAFSNQQFDPKNPEGVDHIWVVDARGASFGLLELTTDGINDGWPAWGPDSRTVYFTRRTNDQTDVWRIAFDPGLPAVPTSWGRIKALWR